MDSVIRASTPGNATPTDASLVSFFHEYPRIIGASNDFQVTVGYFAGIGYTAIPYLAVALFFLIVGVVFVCVPWRVLLCLPRRRPRPLVSAPEPATFFYAKKVASDEKSPDLFSEEDTSTEPSAPVLDEEISTVAAETAPPASNGCRFLPPPLCAVYPVSATIGLVLMAGAAAVALAGVIVSHQTLDDTLGVVRGGSHAVRLEGRAVVSLYTNASGELQSLVTSLESVVSSSSLSGLNFSDIPAQAKSIYRDVANVLNSLDSGLGSVNLAESIHFGLMLACAIVLLVLAFLTAAAFYLSNRFAIRSASVETARVHSDDPVALNQRRSRWTKWFLRITLLAPVLFAALSWVGLGASVVYGVLDGDLCSAASARQVQLLRGENIHGETGGPDHISSHSLDHLIYCPAVTSLTHVLDEQQRDLDKVSTALEPLLHHNITLQNYKQVIQDFESTGGFRATLLHGVLTEGEHILDMLSNGTQILEQWRACGPVLNILADALQEQCNSGIQAALLAFIGFILCVVFGSILLFYIVGCSKAQNQALGL